METGSIINKKYQVIEKVGKGAFSNCYRVNLLNEDGTVIEDQPALVLKVSINPDYSFLNEFTHNQELSTHNRVLRYKGYGVINSAADTEEKEPEHEFLVSDLMPNGDMFKYVNNEGFDEGCARFIFRHILKGIESIHKDGYAHLDIKLGNILLDTNYLPKLADFGFLQKLPDEDVLQSSEFKYKGTRHYISPEVHEGTTFSGKSADIFALGVCFFILLVGDYPFNAATKSDTKYKNFYKTDPFTFWKRNSRAKKKINRGKISDNFIDLITKMLVPAEFGRISLDEIKQHPWYLEPAMCVSRIKDYFESLKSAKEGKGK